MAIENQHFQKILMLHKLQNNSLLLHKCYAWICYGYEKAYTIVGKMAAFRDVQQEVT